MAALSHYYSQGKAAFARINPADMAQLGEDWMIAAAAGAGMALLGSAFGGLDKTIAGIPVPLDGAAAVGIGTLGLSMHSRELKIASIALGGSAAVRTFSKIFGKGLGAHGEIDEWSNQGYSGMFGFGGTVPQFGPAYGFGWNSSPNDRLVQAAKGL